MNSGMKTRETAGFSSVEENNLELTLTLQGVTWCGITGIAASETT